MGPRVPQVSGNPGDQGNPGTMGGYTGAPGIIGNPGDQGNPGTMGGTGRPRYRWETLETRGILAPWETRVPQVSLGTLETRGIPAPWETRVPQVSLETLEIRATLAKNLRWPWLLATLGSGQPWRKR